jgi:5-hydroxyisourate hydrolase
MGRLTTHVLDLTRGLPAAGMTIEVASLAGATRNAVKKVTTNRDGRCDAPLLEGEAFKPGEWQLEFYVGDYFASHGAVLDNPRFLNVVVIRFGIANPNQHLHVPLLVTPWSYSTYRGS